MNEQLKSISPLTGEQWERAKAKAETLIRKRFSKPDKRAFLAVDSKYPLAVRVFGVFLLLVVTIAAFMVSAGKQVVAADKLYQELIANSARITPDYVTGGIVAVLLLAEFSVIAFGYGAKVSVSERVFRLWRFNLTAGSALRGLQVASMTIAVGGNLTAFALTYTASVWAFDLLITLAAPLTVVGVGVMIENLVSESVLDREQGLRAYRAALDAYNEVVAHPEAVDDWYSVWGQAIFDGLRALKRNQAIIDAAVETDPSLYQVIVGIEWQRHSRTFIPPEKLALGTEKFPIPKESASQGTENSQDAPTSPKFNFAVTHLVAYPERMEWTGRYLEKSVPYVDGKPISYRTWNDAKPYAQARLAAPLLINGQNHNDHS